MKIDLIHSLTETFDAHARRQKLLVERKQEMTYHFTIHNSKLQI